MRRHQRAPGTQVLALLSQELDMALPTTALFDYPTVEALGYFVAASRVRPSILMPIFSAFKPWFLCHEPGHDALDLHL